MKDLTVTVDSLSKVFNRRSIFDGVSFTVRVNESFAITGKNGSGKSTLAKLLCGLLSPTSGTVRLGVGGKEVGRDEMFQHVGLVAPYINLYEEFSGAENLRMIGMIRNLPVGMIRQGEELLREFGIFERKDDEVRTYSSGMKQRLKYAAALIHRPEVLILDEPTSNLDLEGVGAVRRRMKEQVREGILIIATNERSDLEFVSASLDLDLPRTLMRDSSRG